NGMPTDLGTLAGDASDRFHNSGATDLNDLSEVIGWSNTATDPPTYPCLGGVIHATLWTPHAVAQDLGTLPGDQSSIPTRINYFNQIVGVSGTSVPCGTDSPFVLGDDGPVVVGRAFIWSAQKGMRDLNTLIRSEEHTSELQSHLN